MPPPLPTLTVRKATVEDLRDVVRLLADDVLGAARESPGQTLGAGYEKAFRRIEANPEDALVVGVLDGQVVATAQVTLLHHISRGGGTRLQVEAVRVDSRLRGRGIGAALMTWVEQYAVQHGATRIQLTSDRRRTDAHRFYERLGYVGSHVGFKREPTSPAGD